MDKTAQLGLPLVMPAQAQKHVTVNEALVKLDAFAQLRLTSFHLADPPSRPEPGHSYFVVGESSGAWAGQAGRIATWANGGWIFTEPRLGWRAWDEEGETCRVFDGTEWVEGAVTVRSSGAALGFRADEFDHVIAPGTSNTTIYALPKNAVVFGVTGRVRVPLQGSGLTSWRLGVDGSDGRYGTGLGPDVDSYIVGLTGSPLVYHDATPLLLTAEGGEFASGSVKLSVHYACLSVPRPI